MLGARLPPLSSDRTTDTTGSVVANSWPRGTGCTVRYDERRADRWPALRQSVRTARGAVITPLGPQIGQALGDGLCVVGEEMRQTVVLG